jgi:hypothetical protein
MRGTSCDGRVRQLRRVILAMSMAGVLAGPVMATANAQVHPRAAHRHATTQRRVVHLVYGHKVG